MEEGGKEKRAKEEGEVRRKEKGCKGMQRERLGGAECGRGADRWME